jgi:hypothetical membrane protein
MQSKRITRIIKKMTDPLASFKIFEITIAVVCICIPLILKLFDSDVYYPKKVSVLKYEEIKQPSLAKIDSIRLIKKDRLGFRESISDYVYSTTGYLFGMLLCVAAMLFLFNGVLYFKNQDTLTLSSRGKWYNVILGLALLGVVCTPHRNATIPHYFFAAIFFLGNAVIIGIFHTSKERIKSIVMAILTVVLIGLSFFIDSITLLWSEWLSLSVIGIHLILESRSKQLDGK